MIHRLTSAIGGKGLVFRGFGSIPANPRWTSLNLKDKDRPVLLDCGSPSTIPGSVQLPQLPLPMLKSPRNAKRVLAPEEFAGLAAYLKLPSPPREIVCYDAGGVGATSAARTSWVLQYYGFNSSVLDGGFEAYAQQGLPAGEAVEPSAVSAEQEVPTIKARPELLATREEIVASIHPSLPNATGSEAAAPQFQLLDVRTPAEFSGYDRKNNVRGGHIPGAKNLPHFLLFEEDGRLKSPEAIREMLTTLGIQDDPTRPVVTICQAGVRASLALIALQKAGFKSVKNYDGSMGEWLNSSEDEHGTTAVTGDD